MQKTILKPQTFLGSNPVLMVSCGTEKHNIITVAWAGIINSIKPMLYISVRKERYSFNLINDSKEFVVNLVDNKLLEACDDCGVNSGKNTDKFKKWNLSKGFNILKTPYIKESPVNLECKVINKVELGSHTMFIAEIVDVLADENILTDGKIDLNKFKPVCYCGGGGGYFNFGERLGGYGFTVKKK